MRRRLATATGNRGWRRLPGQRCGYIEAEAAGGGGGGCNGRRRWESKGWGRRRLSGVETKRRDSGWEAVMRIQPEAASRWHRVARGRRRSSGMASAWRRPSGVARGRRRRHRVARGGGGSADPGLGQRGLGRNGVMGGRGDGTGWVFME